MSKVHVDHGPAKKRTPESRQNDAKKILESRPQREHKPKGEPRVLPTVLSPAERRAKASQPVEEVIATIGSESAGPAEVVIEDKPKKSAKKDK